MVKILMQLKESYNPLVESIALPNNYNLHGRKVQFYNCLHTTSQNIYEFIIIFLE